MDRSDSELLEWRDHDSHCMITHTGFGPYMVERLSEGRFRAWLPDEGRSARLSVDSFESDRAAREFCQRDVDGRRTLKFIAEAEAAFDTAPHADDDAETASGLQRALLNAAAPDMLAALLEARLTLAAHDGTLHVLRLVEDAIAKATTP